MTELGLTVKMRILGSVDDFLVILKDECHKEYNGVYYVDNRVAVVYTIDDEGRDLPLYKLEKTAIHELTHHILYHHSKWKDSGEPHDYAFRELFNALLNKYYRNNIPVEVLEILKEEEKYEEDRPFK